MVGVDIFRRNSSNFSYSAYMYAVMKICILTYRGISGAAFPEKTNMPLYFSFIIFKQNWRNNYTTDVVTRETSFLKRKYSASLTTKRQVPRHSNQALTQKWKN